VDWKNPPELKKKGHFSKLARVTFTEGILKDKRVREWPGPASYKKPFGDFDSTLKKKGEKGESKVCAFISEAQFRSSQSPSPGANNVSFVAVEPNPRVYMIKKSLFPHPKEERTSIIKKDTTKPSPGDYNYEGSYNKTQSFSI
jgi:hypothetical protein